MLGVSVVPLLLLVPATSFADDEPDNSLFEGGSNTYTNWIEISAGALLTSGDRAQAEERHRLNQGAFGGIEDLRIRHEFTNKSVLTLDGRAIYDNRDYAIGIGLAQPEKWFVRLGFENFRTWYNTDGGFYPPAGFQYIRDNDAAELDRGEISFEAGLTLKKLPALTFKYTHAYRDGNKSSTSWGPTHPLGTTLIRGISPTFYDIDETRDIFELNARQHIKKTGVGLGLRFETSDLTDARKVTQFPGEPTQRFITDRQGVSYDMFSVHAFTETWLKNNLFFSTGFLFTDMCSDFSGNRIYGDDFDVRYSPNPANGLGFTNLIGGAHLQEYVLNANVMMNPLTNLIVVPSLRVQKECWDADSAGFGTLGNNSGPFSSTSDRDSIDVRERIDARYVGVTNWVFWASTEWTEGQGNLDEDGGLSQVGGVGSPPVSRNTDDRRFFQKYSLGAKWYPLRKLTVDVSGYYKRHDYDYDHDLDSTPNNSGNRYPAYLTMQNFETWDGSARLTLRPLKNVTLVSRYEYQFSTIHTKADPVSLLGDAESAEMTSHIFAQNVSWIPWSRLSLQAGFNVVFSETESGASGFIPTGLSAAPVLEAQNNYWTVNVNSTLVLDDKTDLSVGYFYYSADDYEDNSAAGLPLGSGAEEHGVTATLVRRLTQNLRLIARYGFYHYEDELYGGRNDYEAHVLFTSLQYRF